MFRIDDNLSNSTILLKKEKKRRTDESLTSDEILENKLWIFLYNIGFTSLNIGRECKVTYGRDKLSISTKKVDIIAEAEEARLYIECSIQKSITSKIKEWIADVSEISKFQKSQNINKNIAYVFYTTETPSVPDRKKLKEAGIKILTEKNLEYLETLCSLYKKLAYFQFLGMLFSKNSIKYIEKENFKIPAIRTKYTSKQKCYLFGINPAILIPLAGVLHKKMDTDDLSEDNNNYQRLVKKQKINAIKKFIKKEGGVFPTNIIISFHNKKKNFFKPIGSKKNNTEFGMFELPKEFQSITVIDGQHRLFAYDGLDEAHKHLIYVIAFENMSIPQQVKTFVSINEKQTKVSSSLMWDLYSNILDESDIRFKISNIAKKLNEQDKDNALYGSISYDSAPYSDKGSKITLESFCTALKSSKIINNKLKKEDFTISIEDPMFYLKEFFNTIQELNKTYWERKDKSSNILRSNQGVGALLKLFDDIIEYLYKKEIKKETYKKELELLLSPLSELVKKLNTKEKIKEFKRTGERGKQEIHIDFVKCIHEKINDFGLDIIEKEEANILDELIMKLKENDEGSDIEAKESFFTNCKRLKDGLFPNEEKTVNKILATIVAFANGKGGNILLGLQDKTWEIKGLDETDIKIKNNSYDKFKNDLSTKIRDSVGRVATFPKITKYIKNRKIVVGIEVKRNPKDSFEKNTPAYLLKNEKPYVRDNGSTIVLEESKRRNYLNSILKEIEEESKEI